MTLNLQFVKALLVILPALATSQNPGISVNWESSSVSAEAHSGSAQLQINTGNPTNSTDNSTPTVPSSNNSTSFPKKIGARKLAGYYPVYNAAGQAVSEIRYDLYDELIFFAATTKDTFEIGTDTLDKPTWDSLAHEFVQTCKKNAVTPTYALGGWGGSRYFSSLVATAENRTAYADSVIEFAKKYGFEGFDLDWEYASIQGIGCNIISDEDVQNQQLFLKEIKNKWREGKLSMASSIAGIRDANYQRLPASDVSIAVEVLDKVRIMAYDVYGGFTKTTGPLAPIKEECADPENQLSVESAIEAYIEQGFKPEQLTLGIPGYAKSWTLAQSTLTPRIVGDYTSYYYQNFTDIPAGGKYDDKPRVDICGQQQGWGGSWLVSELVERGFLNEDQTSGGNGFTKYYDACSEEPFLVSNSTLISFDDTESTVAKVVLAKTKNLGGIYFFDTMGPLDQTVSAARKALLN